MAVQALVTALGPTDSDDGDKGRQQRGLAIAILAQEHIRPDKFGYKVPSQSGNGVYLVNLEDGPYCTCMDFEKRGLACKHVYAVEALLQRSEQLEQEPPQAVRITQPWAAYNESQIHEGELFAVLLRSLCDNRSTTSTGQWTAPPTPVRHALWHGPQGLLDPEHPPGHVRDSRCGS